MAITIVPSATLNSVYYWAFDIPVITSAKCKLFLEIYRRSVYRDDNGDPLPVKVESSEINQPTMVRIMTPIDHGTTIRVKLEVNGKEITRPFLLSLPNCKVKALEIISDPPSYILYDESNQSKTEGLPSMTRDFLLINTIDPDDLSPDERSSDASKIERVNYLLNRNLAFRPLTFSPATSPLSQLSSPKLGISSPNRASPAESPRGLPLNHASRGFGFSPKNFPHKPGVFTFDLSGFQVGTNNHDNPKSLSKTSLAAKGAGAGITHIAAFE